MNILVDKKYKKIYPWDVLFLKQKNIKNILKIIYKEKKKWYPVIALTNLPEQYRVIPHHSVILGVRHSIFCYAFFIVCGFGLGAIIKEVD